MNRRIYATLTVLIVSFVLVLGLGTFNVAKALTGTSNESMKGHPTDNVNACGDLNSLILLERDLEADAPNYLQDRDRDNYDHMRSIAQIYPCNSGYGNLGGES